MDANDWVQMAGHPLAGRGGRPINPKLAPYVVAKARPAKSAASARQARLLIVQAARLTQEVDEMLPSTAPQRRARSTSPSILQQSQPGAAGAAARLRHAAVVQQWRKWL